jgi:hypothetical protein
MQVPAPTEMDLASGYTGQATVCDNALLVPFGETGDEICHVTDPSTGRMVYRHRDPCDLPLDDYGISVVDAPAQKLGGTYILGGYLSAHLGHFLTGTLAPLWALDHHDGPVDGVLCFIIGALDTERAERAKATATGYLKQLGIDLPILTVTEPTRVDHVILAEHGIGSYSRARGSSYYHSFMRKRNALTSEQLSRETRQKLYITRSKLKPARRGIVGEAAIEKTFAAAGYEIYAPEKYSLADQIAKYQTADTIVALDGTPFHLIPSVCPADARIAIVSRRGSVDEPSVDFAGQIEAAIGHEPFQINRIIGEWRLIHEARNKHPLAVLDLEKTYQDFVDGGFLDASTEKVFPTEQEIKAHLLEASVKVGAPYGYYDFETSQTELDVTPAQTSEPYPAQQAPAAAPDKPPSLEQQVQMLRDELEELRAERQADRAHFSQQIDLLRQAVDKAGAGNAPRARGFLARSFGSR